MSVPVPCPPTGATDCQPEVQTATATLYVLRNKRKQRNYIEAEITEADYFKCFVVNLPKDKTGCPGWWLFQVAWDYFIQEEKVTIKGVRGDWTFGDNLATINRLTAGNQMTLEEASKHTWTFQQASQRGFTRYQFLGSDGGPGNYTEVQVVFLS
jgi:hypothetical protein